MVARFFTASFAVLDCRCKMLFNKKFGDGDDVMDGTDVVPLLISNATLFVRYG